MKILLSNHNIKHQDPLWPNKSTFLLNCIIFIEIFFEKTPQWKC